MQAIIAVDTNTCQLKQIVGALSRTLGYIPKAKPSLEHAYRHV